MNSAKLPRLVLRFPRIGIAALIAAAEPGEIQVLFVLLAATGMRISEALALEARHFIHGGRTILVEQQVDKDCPRIIPHLKTDAAFRQIDLHPDVAAYLQRYVSHKTGLIFHTTNNTPYLYGNLADDWLDPLLTILLFYEEEIGWHAFRRFRNTWLRGKRCPEDFLKFWMAHKPKDMSENYSALKEDLAKRWEEVERVGYGFLLSGEDVPNVPRKRRRRGTQKAPATGILVNRMKETRGV
jgi:integrase